MLDSLQKVKVGNDQEMAQSERNFHSTNQVRKTTLTIRYVCYENIVRNYFNYFPIGGHSVTNIKTDIICKQHITLKHKTIRTATEVSP